MRRTYLRAAQRLLVAPPARPSLVPRSLAPAPSGSATHRSFASASAPIPPAAPASGSSTEQYDIVIIGGGPAGLALAAALGTAPALSRTARIALVEGGSLDRVRAWAPDEQSRQFENRCVSLNASNLAFLTQIGTTPHLSLARTAPIQDMQVWDGLSGARIAFAPPGGSTEMARIVENVNIQRALLRHVERATGVRVLEGRKVGGIERDEGGWPVLELEGGERVRARLLIGADGPNSPVRHFSKIESYGWAYPTHGVVSTLSYTPLPPLPSAPHHTTTAFQRFLPSGPVAFLPLPAGRASLVWSTRPELAAQLKRVEPDALALLINAAFRLPWAAISEIHSLLSSASATPPSATDLRTLLSTLEQRAGISPHSALSSLATSQTGVPDPEAASLPPLVTSVQPGSTASFPLRFSHAESYTGTRTALVGDAAHTVHPLAGQGLNMGLADVASLAAVLERAARAGADVGSHTALLDYPRERYVANHALLSATDKLHKLYALEAPPAVWARSVGLEVVNELAGLKDLIIGQAGGSATAGPARTGGVWDALAGGMEGVGKAAEMVGGAARLAGSLGRYAVEAAARGVADAARGGARR